MNELDRKNNYIMLAEIFQGEDKLEKALENYIRALEFVQDNKNKILILFRIALIYDELGEYVDSIKIYDRIIKLDDKQSGAYYGRAIAYEELNEFKKAFYNYYKSIEINPEYDRAYYYLANLYDQIGDLDNALKYYKKTITIAPKDYRAYNNIAGIYEELNMDEKAIKMVDKSLELNADFYQSLYNKGVLEGKSNNNKKALHYYYRAIDAKEDFGNSYLNISEIYIENKRYIDAIKILTKGIKQSKKMEDLYYNRACCYSLIEKDKQALDDLEKAISISDDIIKFAKRDKDLERLSNNDRFKRLIKE